MAKLRLRWLSWILSFTLLFLGISPQILLAAAQNQQSTNTSAVTSAVDSDHSPYRKKNVRKLVEISEKRDQHSKTYLNDDGSYTSEISQESRHFKKSTK